MSFTSGQTVREFAAITLSARLLRKSTADSYMQTVRHLGMDEVLVEEVTVQFLYQKLLTIVNVNTKRKHTVALRTLFRDVLPDIKDLKICKSVPRVYDFPTKEEMLEVVEATPYRFYGLLMMYAGLRIGEACAVSPKDVKGNVLKVHKQRDEDGLLWLSKTQGEVIIPEWLADEVRAHTPSTVTPGAVRESLWRYGRKLGITVNPHMFRHFYATTMVGQKVNPEIAKRQLRHSDLKTTLGYYAQVQKSDIDDAVNDLFGEKPKPVEEKPEDKAKKKTDLEAMFAQWLKKQGLED
ncbi:tyrosine-type recombinase/integrase [Streptomyces sp. B1I3]|uniref:tyrosine-type recombinase/integrase n=1 Tax=Streptomyces sp. B1I3 TaxID=3042264 RepID=UPI00277DCA2B|nr:tyrosine-type recombinase/integrase [Streptomyces sp. B1I3]MDQ0793546.1 integrase [Streptomyces sp. B1I3]